MTKPSLNTHALKHWIFFPKKAPIEYIVIHSNVWITERQAKMLLKKLAKEWK